MKEKQVCVLMVAALTMLVVLVGTTVAADSVTYNCSQSCGGKDIPHPFGINDTSSDSACFLGSGRLIPLHCNESQIYAGKNLQVLNIDIFKAEIDVLFHVSKYCGGHVNRPKLNSGSYTISSKENKFVTVGNNSYGYYNSYRDENMYSTGCLTRTYGDQRSIDNGICSGIGCCQVDIPPKMWNISIEAYNFNTSSEFCSYSFVVRNGSYNFSSTHLSQGLPFERKPVVLDWTIGGFDENCSTASNGINNGCKKNSYCDDEDADFGYRCHCNTGFKGNPYHPNGCTGQFSYSNFGNLRFFF